MSKTEWFRRSTWTDADREEFNARLKRSRGASSKAQYLRIQALHLAEAGHHEGAIELLDRLLTQFPDSIEIAQAHAQKADSLAELGQTEAAIEEYRTALQRQRDFPNVRTNAWLVFEWFVVEKQLTRLYGEVARVLEEFRDEGGLRLPAIEYPGACDSSDARRCSWRENTGARVCQDGVGRGRQGSFRAAVSFNGRACWLGARTFANRLRTLAGS